MFPDVHQRGLRRPAASVRVDASDPGRHVRAPGIRIPGAVGSAVELVGPVPTGLRLEQQMDEAAGVGGDDHRLAVGEVRDLQAAAAEHVAAAAHAGDEGRRERKDHPAEDLVIDEVVLPIGGVDGFEFAVGQARSQPAADERASLPVPVESVGPRRRGVGQPVPLPLEGVGRKGNRAACVGLVQACPVDVMALQEQRAQGAEQDLPVVDPGPQ